MRSEKKHEQIIDELKHELNVFSNCINSNMENFREQDQMRDFHLEGSQKVVRTHIMSVKPEVD